MVRLKNFREHRLWEDWLTIGLGALIGLTPWLAGETDSETIMLHTGLIGALVLALGAFEFVDLRRWEEILQIACGLWLMAAPFLLGYAETGLAVWHYVLGAIVALLAAFELWQDWKLGAAELARHGQ
jgi:O-antigen/teichoic acid export membrane protein